MCRAVVRALAYLHGRGKIHRDIKAGNILLNEAGHVKLADFGVAGQLSDQVAKRQTVIGTPFWVGLTSGCYFLLLRTLIMHCI